MAGQFVSPTTGNWVTYDDNNVHTDTGQSASEPLGGLNEYAHVGATNTEPATSGWTDDNYAQMAGIWNDPNVSMDEKTNLMSQYNVSAADLARATGYDMGNITSALMSSGEVSSGFGGATWTSDPIPQFGDVNTPQGRAAAQQFFLANKDDPKNVYQAMQANGIDVNTFGDLMSYNGLFNMADANNQYGGAEKWMRDHGMNNGDVAGLDVYTPDEIALFQDHLKGDPNLSYSKFFENSAETDPIAAQMLMQGWYDERDAKSGLVKDRAGTGYSLPEGYGSYEAPWTQDKSQWYKQPKPLTGYGPNYARDNAPGGVNNGGAWPTPSPTPGPSPTPSPTPGPSPTPSPTPGPSPYEPPVWNPPVQGPAPILPPVWRPAGPSTDASPYGTSNLTPGQLQTIYYTNLHNPAAVAGQIKRGDFSLSDFTSALGGMGISEADARKFLGMADGGLATLAGKYNTRVFSR